ncbi:MAG: Uma2 family endonuclease [Cyanobacteriota bacterium]|nr:Uma2 family endonuclease [Cyanobacteriota bacterium]
MVNLSPTETRIPPLENGDRLTLPEFERRYSAALHIKKAELIEGVVYMASPLRFESHAEPHSDLMGLLWTYKRVTPGVRSGIEPTVRLDEENEPQPDGVLFLPQTAGGNVRIAKDDYLEGAPELVVEIAASSVAIDLHAKKKVYGRNGVREYLVWQIFENQFEWFSLQGDQYVLLEADGDKIIKSVVFPGLWLTISALQQGKFQQVMEVLQAGLNSIEHQAFVQKLAENLGTSSVE